MVHVPGIFLLDNLGDHRFNGGHHGRLHLDCLANRENF